MSVEKLLNLVGKSNVASGMSEEKLDEIAAKVLQGYQIDRESRSKWEEMCEEAIKFAKQISEPKSFPWEGASNVIFPLLTTAANIFASRVYPEIIKEGRIVKVMSFGADPTGEKAKRADRVATHMSYQRLIQSDTWEPDTDKMLHMLPIVGVCFRKVYYDSVGDLSESDLCSPMDIVVNHSTPSMDKSYRTTHKYFLNQNDIIERMRSGKFIKFDLSEAGSTPADEYSWDTNLDSSQRSIFDKHNRQVEFLEQHTFLDLDGDGYEEPWIVVVNKETAKTVGIFPRFNPDTGIKISKDGEILKIKPIQYFVDYHFLPSPDGGFYSLGYGHILYPLNQAINSIMNQLIDAGTLANTTCGLMSRTLKIKGGKLQLKMGEFVPVDPGTTGRLQDSFAPINFKDPSPVLLQLLSLVINSAKEIASINDVLTGEANPQNSPAGSVSELASQGMNLIASIKKRTYRSLKKEFQLLYDLNSQFLSDEEYFNFQDDQQAVSRVDYARGDLDISPIADPNMGSDVQRATQANAINMLMQNQSVMGEIKVNAVVHEFFEALRIPEDRIAKLLLSPEEKAQMQQQQGPNIDVQKLELDKERMASDFKVKMSQVERANKELELRYMDLQLKYDLKQQETDEKQARMQADAELKHATKQHMGHKLDIESRKVDVMARKVTQENNHG